MIGSAAVARDGHQSTSRTELMRRHAWIPESVRRYNPKSDLGKYVKAVVVAHLPREAQEELIALLSRSVIAESRLWLRKFTGAVWDQARGVWTLDARARLLADHGLVGSKVVTTAGVGYMIDALQNITEPENMKYHGMGTGSTAEATGDTGLVTELTTQLNPDSTRATGTTTEGASANIYRSVGTLTVDATVNIQEHGLFSQAATGGGVLFDRTVHSADGLNSGESLQYTYEWTLNAGG
jgi:hypothetical protein